MTWNWQQANWPTFTWDERKLARAEALFIERAGVVIGASKHLSADERNGLSIEMMSHEAVDTSAIEGERLDRDSVQTSIRRHLGLESDHRRAAPAEANDEWAVQRGRDITLETIAQVSDDPLLSIPAVAN
jgi:Fic family protein